MWKDNRSNANRPARTRKVFRVIMVVLETNHKIVEVQLMYRDVRIRDGRCLSSEKAACSN